MTSSLEADANHHLQWQDEVIEREIPDGASVLDLGCGTGELLSRLMDSRHVRGQGIEIDPAAVTQCIARQVPVFQSDLDEGLAGFRDQSFDYVVLEETLQALQKPLPILQEMLRVGRCGIVSFPNFGHQKVRTDLLSRGRMPVTDWLPYEWHNSPNIHLFTLADFLDLAVKIEVHIEKGFVLADGQVRPIQPNDNEIAEQVLLFVQRR